MNQKIHIFLISLFLFSLPLKCGAAQSSFCDHLFVASREMKKLHSEINIPEGLPRSLLSNSFGWVFDLEEKAFLLSVQSGIVSTALPPFRLAVLREVSQELGDRVIFD